MPSARAERARLSAELRAEGKTWAQIASTFRERYGVSARTALRLAHGWSQARVAAMWTDRWPDLPRSANHISSWEGWPHSRSGHAPTFDTLDRLAQLYQCDIADLIADLPGWRHLDSAHPPVRVPLVAAAPGRRPTPASHERLAAESDLFDTMELANMATASALGAGAVDAISEGVDLLCRAYPTAPAASLRDRAKQRLDYVMGLLDKRLTLAQHRDLLVQGGWLAALVGCVHYDLGEREQAETARVAAHQLGHEAGHPEIVGWAAEMAAWYALTEGRPEDALGAAQRGQNVTSSSSAAVQLALQEAKAHARLGDRQSTEAAIQRSSTFLAALPTPEHAEHHFVFDQTKWAFYAAALHALVGNDDQAEEHAREVLANHIRPDGTTNAPMRVADARMDLALVHARRGELDGAIDESTRAIGDYERRSASLTRRVLDLTDLVRDRYPGDPAGVRLEQLLVQLLHPTST